MKILFYLLSSISIVFTSMVFGIILSRLIAGLGRFSALKGYRLIRNDSLASLIGLGIVKWFVCRTFWIKFNPGLRITGYPSFERLTEVRDEMTRAEVAHILGFLLVTIAAVVFWALGNWTQCLILMVVNFVFNLYPVFLQQINKTRIEAIIRKASRQNTGISKAYMSR